MLDHRVQHLRGNNNWQAATVALANDLLLDDGDLFRGNLNSQVAARYHDTVGDVENRIQVYQRLGLLNLGNEGNDMTCLFHDLTGQGDVLRTADEREGNVVNLGFQGKLEVSFVLRRESLGTQSDPRHVHAFVGAEHSAKHDLGNHLPCAVGSEHLKFQLAIVKQDAVAWVY